MPIVDPNIVYLALIFGLWLGVTAAYVPGTGLLELLSAGVMIGAVIALGNMPTNWVAVIMMIVGTLGFIIMPFLKHQYAGLSIGGLLLQTAGSLFMFNGPHVSPMVIGLMVVLSLGYYRYILIPTLEKTRNEPLIDENNGVIGARGRVIKALDPVGTVNVRGELWTASSDRPLKAGDDVVVVDREGLNIIVEGVKHKRAPLNGHEE